MFENMSVTLLALIAFQLFLEIYYFIINIILFIYYLTIYWFIINIILLFPENDSLIITDGTTKEQLAKIEGNLDRVFSLRSSKNSVVLTLNSTKPIELVRGRGFMVHYEGKNVFFFGRIFLPFFFI